MKAGDKIKIPCVEKSASGLRLEECSAVYKAKQKGQDFLFLIKEEGEVWAVGATPTHKGSKFYTKDIELYEQEEIYNIY